MAKTCSRKPKKVVYKHALVISEMLVTCQHLVKVELNGYVYYTQCVNHVKRANKYCYKHMKTITIM